MMINQIMDSNIMLLLLQMKLKMMMIKITINVIIKIVIKVIKINQDYISTFKLYINKSDLNVNFVIKVSLEKIILKGISNCYIQNQISLTSKLKIMIIKAKMKKLMNQMKIKVKICNKMII